VNKKLSISVIGLIYIVVGIIIAVSRHYITIWWLKVIASGVLAVFLWWLVLLGVNLHLH
jgi:undecaprenyl pyrophosphate phosphatase UppP